MKFLIATSFICFLFQKTLSDSSAKNELTCIDQRVKAVNCFTISMKQLFAKENEKLNRCLQEGQCDLAKKDDSSTVRPPPPGWGWALTPRIADCMKSAQDLVQLDVEACFGEKSREMEIELPPSVSPYELIEKTCPEEMRERVRSCYFVPLTMEDRLREKASAHACDQLISDDCVRQICQCAQKIEARLARKIGLCYSQRYAAWISQFYENEAQTDIHIPCRFRIYGRPDYRYMALPPPPPPIIDRAQLDHLDLH